MALRATPTALSLPADTYLLVVDGVIQPTQLGFAWRDALDLIWSGAYNAGDPRLLHMDLARGTVADATNAALIELADRAFVEREIPAHLAPLFRAAGISAVLPPAVPLPALPVALGRRRAALGAH